MRDRILPIIAAVMLAALYAGAALAAQPEARQLAPGVWAFIGGEGRTNSGFIETDLGVVVIDTQGPPELAKLLRVKILEVTEKPVTLVINTHYHGDHTFGNQYFADALILAHENTRKALVERDEGHRTMFLRFFGEDSLREFRLTLPQATFNDRMTLMYGGKTIELIYAGGSAHTGGDIFVWLPDEKVLFAGDLLYKGRLPLLNDGDSRGAAAAVEGMLATGARVFVPGHGELADAKDAAAYRGFLEALRSEVGRMKREGMTKEEVRAKISLPGYSGWLMYKEWLSGGAAKVYDELASEAEGRD